MNVSYSRSNHAVLYYVGQTQKCKGIRWPRAGPQQLKLSKIETWNQELEVCNFPSGREKFRTVGNITGGGV